MQAVIPMQEKEYCQRPRRAWLAVVWVLMTTPAAVAADRIEIELHVTGAIRADRVLKAAIDDHHFCRELTRGWIHSVMHGLIRPGDAEYFAVPIYLVTFNQSAPHLQVGLDGHPGFSLDIDAYDHKTREYDGDSNAIFLEVALNRKHYNGHRGDHASPGYNPGFHYHVLLDADGRGGRFTAGHLVENNGGSVIDVTGSWQCR